MEFLGASSPPNLLQFMNIRELHNSLKYGEILAQFRSKVSSSISVVGISLCYLSIIVHFLAVFPFILYRLWPAPSMVMSRR